MRFITPVSAAVLAITLSAVLAGPLPMGFHPRRSVDAVETRSFQFLGASPITSAAVNHAADITTTVFPTVEVTTTVFYDPTTAPEPTTKEKVALEPSRVFDRLNPETPKETESADDELALTTTTVFVTASPPTATKKMAVVETKARDFEPASSALPESAGGASSTDAVVHPPYTSIDAVSPLPVKSTSEAVPQVPAPTTAVLPAPAPTTASAVQPAPTNAVLPAPAPTTVSAVQPAPTTTLVVIPPTAPTTTPSAAPAPSITASTTETPSASSLPAPINGNSKAFAIAANKRFATLTADTPCTAKDDPVACIGNSLMRCENGGYKNIVTCRGPTRCFALPLEESKNYSVACVTVADAANRMGVSVGDLEKAVGGGGGEAAPGPGTTALPSVTASLTTAQLAPTTTFAVAPPITTGAPASTTGAPIPSVVMTQFVTLTTFMTAVVTSTVAPVGNPNGPVVSGFSRR